ncbi:MAG: DMT family transporter [Candidatus Magasanikbacteria bacterium]
MLWFSVALLGYLFLVIVFILDKVVVSQSRVKPVVYTFYSTIFMFGALLALPFFGWGLLSGLDWYWAIISGVAFGLALWTFYKAVQYSEISHIGPFVAAIITVFLYIIGYYCLAENLNTLQIGGIIILFIASLLLSFEKSRKHSGFHVGFVWAILAALLFAISHASAKYLYGIYSFETAFIWTRATTGLVGLFVLFFPVVRETFKRKKNTKKTYAGRHAVGIVVTDKVLGVLSVICIQYAISIGSPTLVQALSGLQFVLMFIFIYILTKLLPKVFKEYFTKRELRLEFIAILLVLVGSALLVL